MIVRIVLAVFLVLAAAEASAQQPPAVPTWVRPGLVVTYTGDSAYMRNGAVTQPIAVTMTTRVTSVSGNVVAGVTQVQNGNAPLSQTISWWCSSSGACRSNKAGSNGKFWVDPADPVTSSLGPNGEQMTVIGNSTYTLNKHVYNATTLGYQNKATGLRLLLVFETTSGLVLEYAESGPAEQMHLFFQTMR